MGWEAFSQHTWFEIGVGNRVKLWQDCWCGEKPLQLTFPILYKIAINKEVYLEFSLVEVGERSWDVSFT